MWLGLCAAMMKGGESDGDKMALKRGWESVGRRQKRRCWLRLAPPFFGGCWKMRERGDFVVISDLGIHLEIQFGNSPLKVWEFKKWK